jgi:hypothetical protein
MLSRRLDRWLPGYVMDAPGRWWRRRRSLAGQRHILFLICDHFEPRHDARRDGQDAERVALWAEEYPRFRRRCLDAFGQAPKHTWFYPPHHGLQHLSALGKLSFDGCGEVELHYHHDGDTSESLRKALTGTLDAYHQRGLLLASGAPPRPAFAFIHGDWALDNSRGGRYCGVNDELTLLRELGCWGDFTMPSGGEAQTRKTNAIYYAIDDPLRPRSHDRGPDARVGRPAPDGLFMMQGPLGLNWRAPGRPRIENASLTTVNWGRPDRVRCWLDCHVHVHGRPEWVFIKLHGHGGPEKDHDALFGERAFRLHQTLNRQYNDGVRNRLHYVTAREAYNIAKAAEAGATGDPSPWRDFLIGPYVSAHYWMNARHRVIECTSSRLRLDRIDAGGEVTVRLARGAVSSLRGSLEALEAEAGRIYLRPKAGPIELVLAAGAVASTLTGAAIAERDRQGAHERLVLEVASEVEVSFTLPKEGMRSR